MIITISGDAGSGKSTLAKMLAKKFGWPEYSIGNLRRERARQLGLSIKEYNRLGEKDPKTDLEVDEYQARLAKKKGNFIIEGRTSWHFIPNSIKIFLKTKERKAAERIYEDLKNKKKNEARNEGAARALADVLKDIRKRKKSDQRRYKKYYNLDVYNEKNYDFVLETTNLSPKEALREVLKYLKTRSRIKIGKN